MNTNANSSSRIEFLSGEGEMIDRIRSFDWSSSLLGPSDVWPQSLHSALSICIHSNFPIAIYWGHDLVLLYNNAWSPIPGNKHPWALGRPAREVWPEIWSDIGPLFEEAFEKRVATGSKDALLPMERHGYTEECYFDFTFTPIYGEKGRVDGIFNAVIETTYRVINERRSEILQNLNTAVHASEGHQDVVDAATAVLGLATRDVPFFFLYGLSPEMEPVLRSQSPNARQCRLLQDWPFRDVTGSENTLHISDVSAYLDPVPQGYWPEITKEAMVVPMKGADGKVTGFFISGISSRRKFDKEYELFFQSIGTVISGKLNTLTALAEERKRAESLAEIDRAKTTFFSNISHEFRTPLTLMLSPLEEVLEEKESLSPKAQENFTMFHRNTLRLQKLVNTLLDFSRIEAGRMHAHFRKIDIAAFTEDLASSFRSAIERAGMTLTVVCEKTVDEVYADVEMWEKIVLNLISNAFKYTQQGTIEVRLRQEGAWIQFSVRDTGSGIAEDELEKIFDRFHRARNTHGRSQEGTGIGLAMVKELVKFHHGSVDVASTPGVGSVFTVRIPAGHAHLPSESSEAIPAPSAQTTAYLQEVFQWNLNGDKPVQAIDVAQEAEAVPSHAMAIGPSTVLLADDNADMRRYITNLLSPFFKVIAVTDGNEAYTTALEVTPDIILTDIMMPGLDGFGLLKKLKLSLSTRHIPVIFLSARAGEEARVDGLMAGADDYLTKPFSSRELIARVTNHLAISVVRRKTEREFYNLFQQSPAPINVFRGPDHVLEFYHPGGFPFVNRDVSGVKAKVAFDVAVEQTFYDTLDRVFREGETVKMPNFRSTFVNGQGQLTERYFDITFFPWRGIDHQVQGVLQVSVDVTQSVKHRLAAEASERKFRNVAQQAPVAMAILSGPTFVIEVANAKALELWGKKYEEVIHIPALEVFPELVAQGFRTVLDNVYHTGQPFIANEMPVTIFRHGKDQLLFVNFIYEPFKNDQGEIEGIVAVGVDVTEQVLVRKKVVDAELKFRTIVEQTPSPLVIFKGKDLVIEVANQAALAVWQVGTEVIGKTLLEVRPEIDGPYMRLLKEVYESHVTRLGFESPSRYLREDGTSEERFFNFVYVPYRDPDGSVSGVLVLATDVTEQVRAKKQLVENEERLRIASEILELGTWEYDPVNDVVFCSDKALELFGIREFNRITLSDLLSRVTPDDKPRVQEAFQQAFEPASPGRYDVEYSLTSPDGQLRTIRANGKVFFDSARKPFRFIGTALDITERKKAEEEIKASEALFRLLTTSIPQIVWTMDRDGRITYISDQFEKYTGEQPEAYYHKWYDIVHPDDREKLQKAVAAGMSTGKEWQLEMRLKHTGRNTYRWFFADSKPFKDDAGRIRMWIGSAADIQDFKEQSDWLEKQVLERTGKLEELNQFLKISNEDLQQFAHVASHDLKEPIRKIKTYSTRLRDEFGNLLPEKGETFLQKILSATERMYFMIDGVLSYSTITSGEQPTETVNLNEVLKNILTDLEVLIQEKKARIISEPLPAVEGSPVLLYQLLYNLLNNSIKFARAGADPEIRILSQHQRIDDRGYEKIVISDNGIGFDQAHAEKIFTTFTRLHSKDKYEGTGLGLALCKKIVQRHGGSISASGERNKGAAFTILLPTKQN